MRVGKGRCDKRLAQRKLSSNQRSENRHLAEWRFSPLIRIVTVYPKICSVIVIGISTTSSRRCDQPPAVRAAPCLSYQVLHILSRKAPTSVWGFSAVPGVNPRIVPLLLPSLYLPLPALVPISAVFHPTTHRPLPLAPLKPPVFSRKNTGKTLKNLVLSVI